MPPLGVTLSEFCRDLWRQKTRESLGYIVRRCLCDPAFSHFGIVPACDRRTDKQTDGHTTTASHGKKVKITRNYTRLESLSFTKIRKKADGDIYQASKEQANHRKWNEIVVR